MKKLISNIGNWTFILLAAFFLIIASCTKDDDNNEEPVNPNPDGKVASAIIGQNEILTPVKVFLLIV